MNDLLWLVTSYGDHALVTSHNSRLVGWVTPRGPKWRGVVRWNGTKDDGAFDTLDEAKAWVVTVARLGDSE